MATEPALRKGAERVIKVLPFSSRVRTVVPVPEVQMVLVPKSMVAVRGKVLPLMTVLAAVAALSTVTMPQIVSVSSKVFLPPLPPKAAPESFAALSTTSSASECKDYALAWSVADCQSSGSCVVFLQPVKAIVNTAAAMNAEKRIVFIKRMD